MMMTMRLAGENECEPRPERKFLADIDLVFRHDVSPVLMVIQK
jgi:hypothetical protein